MSKRLAIIGGGLAGLTMLRWAKAEGVDAVRDGILADVAPTLLRLMGLEVPEEMTGTALV